MGKASSNKKVARAARAAGRPGAKKSYAWPLAITGVVVVGVLLVVLSFGGDEAEAGGIKVGDHWHAAYGIYNCDTYLPPLSADMGQSGIHTHQDNLMHLEPASSRATGDNANVGLFATETGIELSDTSLQALGMDVENGDECGGEPATLKLLTWGSASQQEPTIIEDQFEDYVPADNSIWVLAFVPEGATVPMPPGVAGLQSQDPNAPMPSSPPPETGSTETTVAGEASTTTIPPDDSTTTTAAP